MDKADAKILDWWYDSEFKEYFALLEMADGQILLDFCSKKEELK